MIFHNFDSDPSNPHKFVWSEVYRQSSDFLFHANSLSLKEYVEKHSELASYFAIEVYGNIPYDLVKKIKSMEIPFTHFKTTSEGYVKEQFFNLCFIWNMHPQKISKIKCKKVTSFKHLFSHSI